ncbi:glycosyltransferase family 4 protein [Pontimicrobium aquaticum]|uniref:Glycosyltransferase family 4 protein n=1 Tax=Pontimicrobium aquaticum TaxID=2565367 RepID=A0A4U0EP77_9FLAO|nr:glycosyltransferase family 4 protein [Pontimicrobium aquaticum]TJY33433.1 glycosyltransferase family 4 protein [Pontimicrobium aquaticum]
MKKIIRITTVPISLKNLLKGQPKFMSQYYEIVGVTSSGDEIIDIIADEGIRVIEVEMTRSITPFKDLASLIKLIKLLRKEKPFIVHSHTPKAGTLGMIAAKLARVPNRLHTIAGLPLLEATGLKRKLLDLVETITYKCATKIYPNSLGLKDIIIENGYTNPSKLKVIGKGSSNGIDVNHFSLEKLNTDTLTELKTKLNISNEDIVFVFVGRLVKDKGINELISAFKRIKKKHVKLLLVGTYEHELDPLNKLTIDEIENNKNIMSVGWQTDVRPYFAISHVLAFPSYREGFPNVVMQAGALHLPCIVTNINGCNEIIHHGVNGLIIPPKNEDKLFDAMLELIDNPEKRQSLAKVSRKTICDNYKREVIWNALLNEYKNLETQ